MTEKTLYAALAKAQAKITAPTKNREVEVRMKSGGKYKFKYATMDHLIEHVRDALTSNGLWFIQRMEDGQMVTRITHESGEFIDCGIPMPNLPNAPQEAGSIITYYKRYAFTIAFGLASDEDDDANVAEGNGYEVQQKRKPATIPDDAFAKLEQLRGAANVTTGALCKKYGVRDLRNLSKANYDDCIEGLEGLLAKKAKEETNSTANDLDDEIPY